MTEDISLFSGLAVKKVLEESVLPELDAGSGTRVRCTFEPTKTLQQLIAGGARTDVFLGVVDAVQQLARDGVLDGSRLQPLVRSGIGIAVAHDASAPSIGTVEELVEVLRGARSVAYSRTGASGAHFAALLDRLDIAEEINERATICAGGFTGEALLDGRADVAVQQVVELASVDGVQVVGPLPPEAQHYVELWAAARPDAPEPALRLLDLLSSPLAVRAYEDAGMISIVDQPQDTDRVSGSGGQA